MNASQLLILAERKVGEEHVSVLVKMKETESRRSVQVAVYLESVESALNSVYFRIRGRI